MDITNATKDHTVLTMDDPIAFLASLENLSTTLSKYDLAEVLALAGGLQLLPENADRSIRFEMLAHALASIPATIRHKWEVFTRDILQELLNTGFLGEGMVQSIEDPSDNLFTEAFTWFGGSYTVFPGIADESTFVLKQLSRGIFLNKSSFPNESFVREARKLITAVLAVSNELARRSGLKRYQEPITDANKKVLLPSDGDLNDLRLAVTFDETTLALLLAEYGVLPSVLECIIAELGSVSLANYAIENGELLRRPIIRAGGKYIVALPGMLVAALRDALIALAAEHNATEDLAKRFNSAVWDTILQSFHYIGNKIVLIRSSNSLALPYVREGFFNLDLDKILYVILVTDPLSNYDPQSPKEHWPPDMDDLLDARLQEISNTLPREFPQIKKILVSIVFQGLVRLYAVWEPDPNDENSPSILTITAADIETLATLEHGDQLLLWKYAQAKKRIRRKMPIVSIGGELDEFGMFRQLKRSFYFTDDTPYEVISIQPGGTGILRRQAAHERDTHGALSFDPGNYIEVTNYYGNKNIPIYVPTVDLHPGAPRKVARLVEALPIPFWIVGPSQLEHAEAALYARYMQVADAIAYWLWQVAPSLAPIISPLSSDFGVIRILLQLDGGTAWLHPVENTGVPDEEPISATFDHESATISLVLSPGMATRFDVADNSGERFLIASLLTAITHSLPDNLQAPLPEEGVWTIINRHMPIGQQKIIVSINFGAMPAMDIRGLPDYRTVQPEDNDELLDILGDYLTGTLGMPIGPIPNDRRTTVLDQIVAFFYAQLQQLIETLSPNELLDRLVAQSEAVIHEVAYQQVMIAPRIACFGREPEMVEHFTKQLHDAANAGIASRFVIEYVAAKSPSGIQPLSLTTYDQLQALASRIIAYGFDRELVQFGLAEIKLEILPSGRLGRSADDLEKAQTLYSSIFTEGEIARATRAFGRLWNASSANGEESRPPEVLERATRAEFGFAMSEMLDFFVEAVQLGMDTSPAATHVPKEHFIKHMAKELGWEQDRVNSLLDYLSIVSRPDFLSPLAPYTSADVYPWRFNRCLSYLRRPFLQVERDGHHDVVWGPRHVYGAWEYLIGICRAGRLQAISPEMKSLMAATNHERGEVFNDDIAALFEGNSDYEVRRRVQKIRGADYPIQQLGDIDVLVVDRPRKALRVVECKRLTVAKTPRELANERENIFIGRNGKKSIIAKHKDRAAWVEANLMAVLDTVGIEERSGWQIEAVIVVDLELMTPYLQQPDIPIVPYEELYREFHPE